MIEVGRVALARRFAAVLLLKLRSLRYKNETRARMAAAPNPYIRERLMDLDDLAYRLLQYLMGEGLLLKGIVIFPKRQFWLHVQSGLLNCSIMTSHVCADWLSMKGRLRHTAIVAKASIFL